MEMKGKVAFVTGGARRIGQTIAYAIASRGSHIGINYRSSKKEADDTVAQLKDFGVNACAVQGDVSLRKDIEHMVRTIEEKLGAIDILVNNASIYNATPWPKISENDWDENLDINLKGPFLCAQAIAPGMVKRKRGKIVNLVDWAVDRPYKDYLPYLVSKAGLVGLTKVLAKELAPHVQVNGVAPGPVLFPGTMTEQEKKNVIKATPLQREGSPSDIANTVVFLIEGTDFATGAIYTVDGGRTIG